MAKCRGMSLDDFKFIYWMEYAHRMWGRVLGLVFAVPASYFAYRGWVNGALGVRLGLLFAMGGTQGLVGWWMVRSGLKVGQTEHVPVTDGVGVPLQVFLTKPVHLLYK